MIEIEDDLEVKTPIPILTNLPQSVSSDSKLKEVVVEMSGLGSDEGAKGGRRFQVSWREKYEWILYDKYEDMVFCEVCQTCSKSDLFRFLTKRDDAFVSEGYNNWKRTA